MSVRCWCLLTVLLVPGLSSLSVAQAPDPEVAALKFRVQQLEQIVKDLERQVDELQTSSGKQRQQSSATAFSEPQQAVVKTNPPQSSAQGKDQPVVSVGRETYTISSPDGIYRLRIGGHLQLDGKFFYGNNSFYGSSPHQLINSFAIRRARPIFEGSLGQYIDFRFVPDFGNGKTALFDAYADIKPSPYSVLRGGKFKVPLGLEELQGDADLTYIERSLATDLVPIRSEGLQFSGNIRGRVSYQAAVLNAATVGQNVDSATNRGKDFAGRIFLTPFAPSGNKALQGLGFGAAATTGRQEGPVLPSFNTSGGQIAFFTYGSGSGATTVVPTAAGRRLNFSPQMYYYYGSLGMMAEYIQSTQKISAVISDNTVVRDISHHAWQVGGSWVVTGEKRSFRGVTPRKGLNGGKEGLGFGTWEIAARYSALRIDPTVFAVGFADPTKSAQYARNWDIGLNWYLNNFVRLTLNYEQTQFVGGSSPNTPYLQYSNRPTEKVFEQQLQFAF